MIEYLIHVLHSIELPIIDATILFAGAVGVSMTLLALFGLNMIKTANNPVRRRLLQTSEGDKTRPSRAHRIDRSLDPIKAFIVPKSGKELSAIRERLVYAGYRGNETVTVYYALKLLLILVLAFTCGLVASIWPGSSGNGVFVAVVFGVSMGVVLPSYYLDKKIKRRRTDIINAFPDVLDLIVACTEAGLGLNDAIQRVSRETTLMFPVLSAELGLVNSQIRAGVDRIEALQGLAKRTGLDEINSFVSMVTQSVRFGTSIADTLRIFAEEFRDRRMQRAEEQAAKVGTMLIFPLVLCIFPSFFVVTIGPAAMSIVRVFEQLN